MIRRWLAALLALGCRSVRIAGNVVDQIPVPESEPFVAAGIASDLGFQRLDVLDNSVRPTNRPDGDEGQPPPESVALIVGELPGRRTLFEIDEKLYLVSPTAVILWRVSRPAMVTAVRGNRLAAAGNGPTALVATRAPCTFAENHCTLLTADESGTTAVVQLGVETLVLSGNHVIGPRSDAATAVEADVSGATIIGEPAITALGNITAGEVRVNGATLQAPWAPLNIRVS